VPILSGSRSTFGVGPNQFFQSLALLEDVGEENLSRLIAGPPSSGGGASGNITYVNELTTTVPASSTGITPSLPTGVAVDDLILVMVAGSQGTITGWGESSYSGWNLLEDALPAGALYVRVLYRFATGTSGDNPPTLTFTGGAGGIAMAGVYRGVDTTTPFIAEALQADTASSASQPTASLTNTNANAWAVVAGVARQVASPLSWTPDAALVERADAEIGTANTNNAAMEWTDSNGPVATGTYSYTLTTSAVTARAATWFVFLKPAAGVAATQGVLDATASATAAVAPSVIATDTVVASATASVGLNPSVDHPGAVSATCSCSVGIGGTRGQNGAVAATASATAAITGTSVATQNGAVAATAAATAAISPSVTALGALSASATTSSSIAGTQTFLRAVSASATATAASGGIRTQLGSLDATAAATAAVSGVRTQFGALDAVASATAAISGVRTQFGALDATAPATVGITTAKIGALAATASATAAIGYSRVATGALNSVATATAAVSGTRTQFGALSATAAATMAIAASRTALGALNATAGATSAIGGFRGLLGALVATAVATAGDVGLSGASARINPCPVYGTPISPILGGTVQAVVIKGVPILLIVTGKPESPMIKGTVDTC
jgi:hypothetical protein